MKRVLYLGLRLPSHKPADSILIHYPVIQIVGRPAEQADIVKALRSLDQFTHLLLTSQSPLPLLFEYLRIFGIPASTLTRLKVIAVGKATAAAAQRYGFKTLPLPPEETAEGLILLLNEMDLRQSKLLWPHAARSRPLLGNYFIETGIPCLAIPVYDTFTNRNLPPIDLSLVDEVLFTSPSTVDAFQELFGGIPSHLRLTTIGPITKRRLSRAQEKGQAIFISKI